MSQKGTALSRTEPEKASSSHGEKTRRGMISIDGNMAAAYVAHATNEICAIYPITPSSPANPTSTF